MLLVRVCVGSRFLRGGAVLLGLGLLLAPLAAAQEKLVTSQETNERIRQLSTLSQIHQGDYVIGPGDLLAIQVFDVAELSRDVRVSEQGTISLPLLPARLHAAGLTEIQVEQKLEEILATSGLITHAQVSITVKERKSNPITVIGAVARPMVYQAVRPVTLLEVLSEAGGILNDAGSVVLITRKLPDAKSPAAGGVTNTPVSENSGSLPNKKAPDTPPADQAAFPGVSQAPASSPEAGLVSDVASPIISINLIDLLETGEPRYNVLLQGGDIVSVPRAGIVYVMGAVERPGGFVLSNDREAMSVLKVMALAGGPKPTAKASQSVILRKTGGQQQELHLDLKRLMDHKTEDTKLNAGDIVFIPDSGGKRAARRIAEVALGVGTGAVIFRLAR